MLDNNLKRGKETRSRLMEKISSKPGISFQELLRMFPITEGTLRYYLHMMEKEKKVHSKMHRGHRCYYLGTKITQKTMETEEDLIKHLSHVQEKILSVIEEMPDLTQKELVRTLRINRFVVSYNIGKLKELGLVRIRKEGRKVHYRRSYQDDIIKEIMRVLASDLLRGQIDEETYKKLRNRLMERY